MRGPARNLLIAGPWETGACLLRLPAPWSRFRRPWPPRRGGG